jgi:16S rRNA (uracil1498-N3)-methyltransferase
MLHRFFHTGPLALGKILLDGPEAHHLSAVSRHQVGEFIILFNGDGSQYPAEIVSITRKQVVLNVVALDAPARELPYPLHIGSALPKADRCDFLIEKLTELGATDFTPLQTARSVVHAKEGRIEKLERAVIEASKQCGRNVLMRIHPPMAFAQWCQSVGLPRRRLIAHPDGKGLSATMIADGVAVAIGPEGGFTDEEVVAATLLSWEKVSLGLRILRIETAAVAVAAILGTPIS